MAQLPIAVRWSGQPLRHWLARLMLAALLLLVWPAAVSAAELRVTEVTLEPCPQTDVAAQPDQNRSTSARCYALRGMVENPGRQPVVDTDVYARILDASGEPVLQNRTRVGSIGDVPPGRSPFALRLAVPAGTPDPLGFSNVKARGFSAPVRSRAGVDDDLLPLEQALQP
jgi:hypothetical protein